MGRERPEKLPIFTMSPTIADIQGTITCTEPCVSECTREHPWEKK